MEDVHRPQDDSFEGLARYDASISNCPVGYGYDRSNAVAPLCTTSYVFILTVKKIIMSRRWNIMLTSYDSGMTLVIIHDVIVFAATQITISIRASVSVAPAAQIAF